MRALLVALLLAGAAQAQQASQEAPGLRLDIAGPALPALQGAHPACEPGDIPDAPARALRLAAGGVQLYASDQRNRVDQGPSLAQLRHECPVVLEGGHDDDPAAYDDRAWIAATWTDDGRTIWAVLHNEFHGHRRPALCPSGRYLDCWFNALTAAVSHDGGRSFQRLRPGLVATLPYRYDQVGLGHHGYFNPSNIVPFEGALHMMAFATRANGQAEGNCLLRTTNVADPSAWRAWGGAGFDVAFIDPYAAPRFDAAKHVCAPVGPGRLRWPVTSLVRHQPSGLFVATMQNGARIDAGGGIYYATSPDLLHWSQPALLMPAVGLGAWGCADPPPLFYPSVLDPASTDRNFAAIGAAPVLFAVRFNVSNCKIAQERDLIRWPLRVTDAPSINAR